MGDRRSVYRILVENPDEKTHMEDLGVDGNVVLKCIFKTWNGET
jgi:hypothetical protein